MLSGIAPLFIFIHQPSEHQAFRSGLWFLCKCYWQCNRYQPRVCPDCIAGHIALIALLWPYRWWYCFDCSDRIALAVLLIVSIWFLCLEVFSAFSIIFTICSLNCERHKTEFTALINHILTSNHPSGSINGHETLDHLELCLDLLPFRHYLQALGCDVASPTLQPIFHYQRGIIPYNRESNGRS